MGTHGACSAPPCSPRGSRSGLGPVLYDFARGGGLEVTGRSISDDGFDARALEIVELLNDPDETADVAALEIVDRRGIYRAWLSSSNGSRERINADAELNTK
jgi:hypothetical protein